MKTSNDIESCSLSRIEESAFMEQVVILSGVRTAVGSYGGALRDIPVYRLGGVVLAEAVRLANVDPVIIDDVIMGSSYQNGECANGARMALLDAGWPENVPGIVLDRRCCSGLDAVFFGATGTIRLVTLLHEMKRRGARWGLETICGGGGQGICLIVERY
jgi:acetyl-CoA acetyltransferase